MTWSRKLRLYLVLICTPMAAPATSTPETVALRASITDLTATFGSRYPGGKDWLTRLDEIEQRAPFPQQDFEKPSRSTSFWPATDEASQAVSRDTSGQGRRRETHDQESPFDRETDFTELEALLSDIGQDVGRAWKQS